MECNCCDYLLQLCRNKLFDELYALSTDESNTIKPLENEITIKGVNEDFLKKLVERYLISSGKLSTESEQQEKDKTYKRIYKFW